MKRIYRISPVIVLLWALCSSPRKINSLTLMPFGHEHGDTKLSKGDDQMSRKISLEPSLILSGKQYRSIYVSSNGVLSFNRAIKLYRHTDLSDQKEETLIAPYWADVDTSRGGDVWYRVSKNPSDLRRANRDIRISFQNDFDFESKWCLIATWNNVAFFGRWSRYKHLSNTFQVILTTDGQRTFVIFLYSKLDWTTGRLNGGNSKGLEGHPSQAGIIANKNVYKIPFSGTGDMLQLVKTSNVGFPGKWVLRIDREIKDVEKDICRIKGSTRSQPNIFITNTPGNKTHPRHACLWPEHGFQCAFNTEINLKGNFMNDRAFCTLPVFNKTGQATVNISTYNGQKLYQFITKITLVNKTEYKRLSRLTTTQKPTLPTTVIIGGGSTTSGAGSGGNSTSGNKDGGGTGNSGGGSSNVGGGSSNTGGAGGSSNTGGGGSGSSNTGGGGSGSTNTGGAGGSSNTGGGGGGGSSNTGGGGGSSNTGGGSSSNNGGSGSSNTGGGGGGSNTGGGGSSNTGGGSSTGGGGGGSSSNSGGGGVGGGSSSNSGGGGGSNTGGGSGSSNGGSGSSHGGTKGGSGSASGGGGGGDGSSGTNGGSGGTNAGSGGTSSGSSGGDGGVQKGTDSNQKEVNGEKGENGKETNNKSTNAKRNILTVHENITTVSPTTKYSPCPGVYIEHGQLHKTALKDNYRVKCNNGYHLHGDDHLVCPKNGEMMDPIPACIQIANVSRINKMALISWVLIPFGIVIFILIIVIIILIRRILQSHKERLKLKQQMKPHVNGMKV